MLSLILAKHRRVFNVVLGNRTWTAGVRRAGSTLKWVNVRSAQASLRTDPHTLNMLVGHPAELDAALAEGRALAEGDVMALRRLLNDVVLPSPDGKVEMHLAE